MGAWPSRSRLTGTETVKAFQKLSSRVLAELVKSVATPLQTEATEMATSPNLLHFVTQANKPPPSLLHPRIPLSAQKKNTRQKERPAP